MDHTLSAKTAKFTSLENLYEYGILHNLPQKITSLHVMSVLIILDHSTICKVLIQGLPR